MSTRLIRRCNYFEGRVAALVYAASRNVGSDKRRIIRHPLLALYHPFTLFIYSKLDAYWAVRSAFELNSCENPPACLK